MKRSNDGAVLSSNGRDEKHEPGVWERWRQSADSEPIDTCAILTTTANQTMRPIHDRMPVIVDPSNYDRWLDRETPVEDAAALAKPYADGALATMPVDQLVNSPKNDVPECVRSLARAPD